MSYGGHFCDSGPKITKDSVYSCLEAQNRIFGHLGFLNRQNLHLKADLPLVLLCFERSNLNLRGPACYRSTRLLKVAAKIVHKLTVLVLK